MTTIDLGVTSGQIVQFKGQTAFEQFRNDHKTQSAKLDKFIWANLDNLVFTSGVPL